MGEGLSCAAALDSGAGVGEESLSGEASGEAAGLAEGLEGGLGGLTGLVVGLGEGLAVGLGEGIAVGLGAVLTRGAGGVDAGIGAAAGRTGAGWGLGARVRTGSGLSLGSEREGSGRGALLAVGLGSTEMAGVAWVGRVGSIPTLTIPMSSPRSTAALTPSAHTESGMIGPSAPLGARGVGAAVSS